AMEYAKWFGETIYIEWKVITGAAGEITAFEVKLYLEDKIKVIDCRLSAANSSIPFSVDDRVTGAPITAGVFVAKNRCSMLWIINFAYPGGGLPQDVMLYPTSEPPIIIPVEDDVADSNENEFITSGADYDLFPYIYMRLWPPVGPEQKARRFVFYDRTCGDSIQSPPGNFFYCDLVRLKALGDRERMEQCAIDFIEGRPPYEGQFVSRPGPIDMDGLPCLAFSDFPAEDIRLIES